MEKYQKLKSIIDLIPFQACFNNKKKEKRKKRCTTCHHSYNLKCVFDLEFDENFSNGIGKILNFYERRCRVRENFLLENFWKKSKPNTH